MEIVASSLDTGSSPCSSTNLKYTCQPLGSLSQVPFEIMSKEQHIQSLSLEIQKLTGCLSGSKLQLGQIFFICLDFSY